MNELIISLVKEGFDFTFTYLNDTYGVDNRQIIFTKKGFRSQPLLVKNFTIQNVEQILKSYQG